MGFGGQGPIKWLVFPFFLVPRRTTTSAHPEWQKHHLLFNILYPGDIHGASSIWDDFISMIQQADNVEINLQILEEAITGETLGWKLTPPVAIVEVKNPLLHFCDFIRKFCSPQLVRKSLKIVLHHCCIVSVFAENFVAYENVYYAMPIIVVKCSYSSLSSSTAMVWVRVSFESFLCVDPDLLRHTVAAF